MVVVPPSSRTDVIVSFTALELMWMVVLDGPSGSSTRRSAESGLSRGKTSSGEIERGKRSVKPKEIRHHSENVPSVVVVSLGLVEVGSLEDVEVDEDDERGTEDEEDKNRDD